MVNSKVLTPHRDDIYTNIKSGNFFAIRRLSNPRKIKELQKPQVTITTKADGAIDVSTGTLSTIMFFGVNGQLLQPKAEGVTRFTYIANGSEIFVRVVIEQELLQSRLRIYSQPIAVRKKFE